MTKSTPAVPKELREFPTQQPEAVTGSTRRGTEGRWLGAQLPLRAGETALHQGQGDTAIHHYSNTWFTFISKMA